jgi:hypothetical protein
MSSDGNASKVLRCNSERRVGEARRGWASEQASRAERGVHTHTHTHLDQGA